MAQHPHLGCGSHADLGAWLLQMCCSYVVGLAPASQSHSENLSGGHSCGPALFLRLPFPVPLPPLKVPKCETLPFCPLVGTLPTSYQALLTYFELTVPYLPCQAPHSLHPWSHHLGCSPFFPAPPST